MKPRNKTEREVVKLSDRIPELSDKQREWAIKTCISEDDAYKYGDRYSRGCFYLVCTFKGVAGSQVLPDKSEVPFSQDD